MVHYKLTYFNARGLAETARQLFLLGGVEFEDNRITWEEFLVLKPNLPGGQVPILEIDGFVISQSAAIWRYLARKFDLSGKTPEEQATADSIIDHFKDISNVLKVYIMDFKLQKPKEQLDKYRVEIMEPAVKVYFSILKTFLNRSKTGFLVGNSLTYADLAVADNLTTLKNTEFFKPSDEPILEAFHQKVLETPKLKEYLEKRPYTLS